MASISADFGYISEDVGFVSESFGGVSEEFGFDNPIDVSHLQGHSALFKYFEDLLFLRRYLLLLGLVDQTGIDDLSIDEICLFGKLPKTSVNRTM